MSRRTVDWGCRHSASRTYYGSGLLLRSLEWTGQVPYLDINVVRNANGFAEQIDPLAQVRKLPHIPNAT